MKKIKYILPLLLATGLIGCGQLQTPSTIETTTITESVTSVDSYAWQEKKISLNYQEYDVKYITQNGVEYDILADVFDEETCTHKIQNLDTLLTYCDTLYSREEDMPHIYLGYERNETYTSKPTLQIPLDEELSFYDFYAILKRTYTSSFQSAEQFGLLYAYAVENNILPEKDMDEVNTKLHDFYAKEDNLFYLDLTLPMLEDNYFTDSTHIPYIEDTLYSFSLWYVEQYSFEEYAELIHSDVLDHTLLETRKNEWLTSLGSSSKYKELCKLLFQYEQGDAASYSFETEDFIWIISNEDVKTDGYVPFFTEYAELEPLMHSDVQEAITYFGDYFTNEKGKPTIKTYFHQELLYNKDLGYYDIQANSMLFADSWDNLASNFLHEYCHYLTMGKGTILGNRNTYFDEWYTEGLSRAILTNQTKAHSVLKYCSPEELKQFNSWDETENKVIFSTNLFLETIDFYEEKQEHPDDIHADRYIDHNLFSYCDRGSMAAYLIETQGFDAFVEYTLQEHTDDEAMELYQDTITWIQAKNITVPYQIREVNQ